MMSSGRGEVKTPLSVAVQRTWALGGVRAYYRGLVVSDNPVQPANMETCNT